MNIPRKFILKVLSNETDDVFSIVDSSAIPALFMRTSSFFIFETALFISVSFAKSVFMNSAL